MSKWTVEQQEVIDSRNVNLLVSAAAGSGKTAVMIARIMRLLEEGDDIERFLIVTFTKAAAGEMRERLQRNINDKVTAMVEANETGETLNHLRQQLFKLGNAQMTTIHAFCSDVIGQYFYMLNLAPNMKIGESAQMESLQEEALDTVLELLYEEEDADFLAFCDTLGAERDDRRLRDVILQLHTFSMSKPQPDQWIQESLSHYASPLSGSIYERVILDKLKDDLSECLLILEEAAILCETPGGPEAYHAAIQSDMGEIEKLNVALEGGLKPGLNQLAVVEFVRLKTIKPGGDVDVDLQDKVKNLREGVKKTLKEVKEKLFSKQNFDYFESQMPTLYNAATQLVKLVRLYQTTYMSLKEEKGVFDFNDLEHLTIQLLEKEEVRESLKNRYSAIFVDEYQDTNAVQEHILSSISKENNRFMVGDIKQSIYGFRLADPDIFLEKYKVYQKGNGNKRVDLSKNFRSRPDVLAGINVLFEAIMSESLGGVDYDAANRLYAGRDFPDQNASAVTLMVLDKERILEKEAGLVDSSDGENEESDPDEIELDSGTATLEAYAIGEEIRQLLAEKDENHYTYGDIVILLRSVKSAKKIYEGVFHDMGIPLSFDGSGGYFQTLEITLFLNILRLIDNSLQDVPLLSALRSPIWQFSLEELMEIRLSKMEGSYHDALMHYATLEEGQRVRSFIDELKTFQLESSYLPLDRFLWRLMMETGYYDYMSAMPGGAEREANLRLLLEKATAFEGTGQSGLYAFIAYLERIEAGAGTDLEGAQLQEEAGNTVQLMSIHKSKGLEFPVVFVANAAGRFNMRDLSQYLMTDKDLGIGLRYVNTKRRTYFESLPQIAMKLKARRQMLSEEMRILYVALTRAVDRLYVVGSVNSFEKAVEKWQRGINPSSLAAVSSPLDWFGLLVTERMPAEIELKLVEQIRSGGVAPKLPEVVAPTDETKIEQPTFNRDIFERAFAWKPQYRHDPQKPYKLGVTNWLKREKEVESTDEIAPRVTSASRTDAFTPIERGNAYHAVLQYLPVEKIETIGFEGCYQETVEKLVSRGIMPEALSKMIQSEKIQTFLTSEIGQSMCRSKAIFKEKSFVYRKGDAQNKNEHLLQGVFDCYFKNDSGLILLDYKTGGFGFENHEAVEEHYGGQLKLYREALENLTGVQVEETWIVLIEREWFVRIN